MAAFLLSPARALPPPQAPAAATTAAPTPHPSPGNYLPVGSPIEFVLDQTVDSKKTGPGSVIHLHLKNPLVVGGVELAPAGAPETLTVTEARPAQMSEVDGTVRIVMQPFQLSDGRTLPIEASRQYLSVDRTAGQQDTEALTDQAVEIVLPVYQVYAALRKGHEMTLGPGVVVRARTGASIDASQPAHVVIATPQPLQLNTDEPHSAFTPIPFYTASGIMPGGPGPHRRSPPPSPSPAPTPSPAPSPAPEAAPGQASPAPSPAPTAT